MKHFVYCLLSVWLISCNSSDKKAQTAEPDPLATEKIQATNETDSAYVYFKHPKNGSKVASPVFIEMGVSGMQIEPAGAVKEGFGHHHILINQSSWPKGTVIPASDSTIHFGKGQTDATIDLPAGEYTLSLQFADGVHTSYGSSMSASINITVE